MGFKILFCFIRLVMSDVASWIREQWLLLAILSSVPVHIIHHQLSSWFLSQLLRRRIPISILNLPLKSCKSLGTYFYTNVESQDKICIKKSIVHLIYRRTIAFDETHFTLKLLVINSISWSGMLVTLFVFLWSMRHQHTGPHHIWEVLIHLLSTVERTYTMLRSLLLPN